MTWPESFTLVGTLFAIFGFLSFVAYLAYRILK